MQRAIASQQVAFAHTFYQLKRKCKLFINERLFQQHHATNQPAKIRWSFVSIEYAYTCRSSVKLFW